MENSSVRTLLVTSAVLALIVAGGYAYLRGKTTEGQSSSTGSTTSQMLSDGTVITVPAGVTVAEDTSAPQPVAPNYRAPIAYGAGVTAEVKAAIEPHFAADVAFLATNSKNFSAWMDLAILHKIGGDYRGAEVIWLYATKAWPESPVAFHNLGDLYQNFLKDPAKAKVYYDQATKLGA